MLLRIAITTLVLGLAACSSTTTVPIFNKIMPQAATAAPENLNSEFPHNPSFWQGNPAQIWAKLQYISLPKLQEAQNTVNNADQNAWIELAIISKRYSTNTKQLTQELMTWRERYPSHPGNSLFPDTAVLSNLFNTAPPKHIALLLPIQGKLAASGQIVRNGFFNGYYQALPSIGTQTIDFYDTSQGSVQAQYQQATAKGADFIVGPLSKDEVQALSKTSITVPTLALNYIDAGFGGLPNNLYEFGLLPEDEAQQIANKARQAGYSHAIIIAPQDKWGERMVAALSKQWQSNGGSIQQTWYFTSQTNFTTDIATLLHVNRETDQALMKEKSNRAMLEQQRRQDFDVIFLLASPSTARQIVPLLRYYYADKIPIYATSETYSGQANPAADADLNGVTICGTPWTLRGKQTPLYALGRDAYLLSHELPRLALLPNFPIYGTTGALTVKSQEVHRRLPCVTIQNGQTTL